MTRMFTAKRISVAVLMLPILVLGPLGGCGTGIGSNPSPADHADTISEATWGVAKRIAGDEPVFEVIGTAFAIDSSRLVTNAHIVEIVSELRTSIIDGERLVAVQHETGVFYNIEKMWKHPQYDPDDFIGSPDVGVLEIRGTLVSAVDLASDSRLRSLSILDDVSLCGFPGDVSFGSARPRATCLSGTISALRPFDPNEAAVPENTLLIQHDIQTSGGTSGSPVFDASGDIIAVNSAATIDETASNRFAMRVDLVRELLSNIELGEAPAIVLEQPTPPDANEEPDDTLEPPPPPDGDGEPDDGFATASIVDLGATGSAGLVGAIETSFDLDVYSLGARVPGDRIVVDADTTGSNLDVSVALFDDQQRLVYANDDRTTQDRFLDSFVDFIVRHASNDYFLVVASSAFAVAGTEIGDYEVTVEATRGLAVPAPVGQILLLDFDGAVIDTPGLGSHVLNPFDARDIASVYTGQTDEIKDAIRTFMENDFAAFDVTIVTTDDPPLPFGTKFSSVHFGGLNTSAFGLSESVDLYNLDCCDDAVIFTESFTPAQFTFLPPASLLAVALANVASHEAGHILGLNHVDDDAALMDDESTSDALLIDQRFRPALLSPDIMPIGTQDSVLLLLETLGPAIDTAFKYIADQFADARDRSISP